MRLLAMASVVGLFAAGTVAPVQATATEPHDRATYCPDRDAYEVTACTDRPRLPVTPLKRQLRWMLRQLSGDAAPVTAAEVRRHFSPALLAQPQMSPDAIAAAFQDTLRQFGPLRFEGFAYPPRPHQGLALLRAESGQRAEVALGVGRRSRLIDTAAVSEASPVIVPRGRYSGWFDVGGRRLFLRCTGNGTPTVVFENGLTTDWYALQNRLSRTTRVCSYDPARQGGPTSRSDSAPAPRTGSDRVRDLHALLTVAHVPGPYVLAGHSNGGLFSLSYASQHPRQVAGLVLIDGVHPGYHRRTFNALKHLIPAEQRPAAWRQLCAVPSRHVDWEQLDICRSEAQARVQLTRRHLRTMPLAVISHGIPEGAPGPEQQIMERVWQRLQDELAAMQPGSEHVIARRSGHDIPHTQPRIVLSEIRKVVWAIRAGHHTVDG